jgi:1,2-dihydroxy-3-keto-5-methylthiopentene dioxygenase
MAVLRIPERNSQITEPAQIKSYLAGIGIDYEAWLVLDLEPNADNETILAAYSDKIKEAKAKGRYTNVDVVNVNPLTPGLDQMLAKFNREHWHDEDEVRFTAGGSGIFHIRPVDGPVVAIQVEPGDMIRVPRGVHHWFDLCSTKEIKAIRFFQDKSGWTPHYTGSNIAQGYEPVCLGSQYIPLSRS